MNYFVPAPTVEEDFVNLVRLELDDIKHTFFKIGFRLREANNCKYYLKLGFDSIEECAEALFGFGKTTTYDLMKISQMFANRETPMHIDSHYEKYSQSQLVLFSQVNLSRSNFISMAKPSDSISKLKKAKNYWTQLQRGKLQSFLGWGRCENFDEFIEKVEECNPELKAMNTTSLAEPEQITIEDNSGYPEKQKDIVIEANAEEKVVIEEEAQENNKRIAEYLIPACANMIQHMCYKTFFDPDNKGFGVRILPEDLSSQMVEEMLKAFDKNRTAIKNIFKNYINKRLGQYDYEIILCGSKQPFSQFCGNVAKCIMDLLHDEWSALVPEKKERKNKK